MKMSKWAKALALAAACSFVVSCAKKEDDDGDGSSGTGAGAGAGTAGAGTAGTNTAGTSAGEAGTTVAGSGTSGTGTSGTGSAGTGSDDVNNQCTNAGEIATNLLCPDALKPQAGTCAPHGECCRRSSNIEKNKALGADDPMVLEYRIINSEVMNHPRTTGIPLLRDAAATRARTCSGEQCLLLRFTLPRSGGELMPGMGTTQVGVGAYNCDGTYSFYDDESAPAREEISDDPARWAAEEVPTMVDPTKTGIERMKTVWASNTNRQVKCSPFLDEENHIDWELCSQGFNVLELPTEEANYDCIGSWNGAWTFGGKHESYAQLAENTSDDIHIVGATFCQTLAFGALPVEMRGMSCIDTPRCMPSPDDVFFDPSYPPERCPWAKLPDSLCPSTDEEKAMWGCHLGDPSNVNGEADYPEVNCTMEPPTETLDPDMGATSKGQCCDPMGMGADGLPACNAFRLVSQYAAAAAEITDMPRMGIPEKCL